MKLLCIDGNSVLNRAYYGIKLLTTKDGRYTNAIFGFMNIFLKLLDEQSPDAVAVAFDVREKTFRHLRYDGYKATRKPMPAELAQQLPVLQGLLKELGYAVVTCAGFEADDILGTFSHACAERGDECVIATGDRDSLQLVGRGTTVLLTTTRFGRGEVTVMDEKAVREAYGIAPAQLIDVKALMGDASDNIPGVSGVGEKTALALIQKFGSLDAVYENLEDESIKPAARERLRADKDNAYLSRELGAISFGAPIELELSAYVKREGDSLAAAATLTGLEMYSTLSKLKLSAPPVQDESAAKTVFARPLKRERLAEIERLWIYNTDSGACAFDGQSVYALSREMLLEVLKSDVAKSVYDAKPFYRLALEEGFEPKNITFDALIAAYLLNPSSASYELPRLISDYRATADTDCDDYPEVTRLPSLCGILEQKIDAQGMRSLLDDIELPLTRVLAKMEHNGFLVDVKGITEFGESLDEVIAGELREIYRLAGREFNLNSPKQLGEVLFTELKLPAVKKTKSGFSTDAETLDKLRGAHPIIEHILTYKTYFKLSSTYVSGLTAAADKNSRIHTEFLQTETRTGRISSANPNLQNIPVRTELGSKLRRYFIAEDGYVLLDADYSQIELRVLAHISGDKRMTEAFRSGRDIHTETAASIFGVSENEVTTELRRRAKAVNFGIVYGIGAFSLAADTGVSLAEADRYIKNYLETYSGVRDYLQKTVAEATENGYVCTMYGRRRNLPELTNSNKTVAALGKRLAMNTPIQGTAADIIKIAMIRVDRALAKEGLDARLILQVHDELIVSAREDCAERAAEILVGEMQAAAELDAPLVADVGRGKSWYEAK